MKTLILSLGLLTLVGCSVSNPTTTSTPSAPQSVDLTLARSLLAAQSSIEQATTLVVKYPSYKVTLNQIIAAYNTAESAYLVYHAALVAGTNPDPTVIQAQVLKVVQDAATLVTTLNK